MLQTNEGQTVSDSGDVAERAEYERCVERGTHSEKTESGSCVECGYAAVDFAPDPEVCSGCGGRFSTPVAYHHTEEECLAAQRASGRAPAPEAEEVVDAVLESVGPSADLVVADPSDQHAVMVAMDAHDAQKFVAALVQQVQTTALARKWVYEIGRGRDITRGLTGDCVEDVVQQMNWTGRCAIGIVEGSEKFEVIEADEGHGAEPFWVCTVAARDERTGSVMLGTSMEAQWMRLKDTTAAKYRTEGKTVREDNKVFDRFSRTKALNKAQRNALEKFIPQEIQQTIIAMAANKPELVERMQSKEEIKVKDLPPPLDTPEAQALKAELDALYDEVKELGGGQGKIKFPPGRYAEWMLQSAHDLAALGRFKEYLTEQLTKIPLELERERLDREAAESVLLVKCPKCEAPSKQRCKDGKGKPTRDCPERLPARREQLAKAAA